MKEKLYESCAKQVQVIIGQHRDKANEISQTLQKINADPRYSQMGKDELVGKLREELNTLNKSKTSELKDVVRSFCSQYQIIHVNDDADAQLIANALKVIDMCGYNLTAELLQSVIEPLKNSYTSLKMIRSLLIAKSDDAGLRYTPQVMLLMDEYIGVNADIISYEDAFSSVESVLDMPELVSAGICGEPDYNNGTINRLIDATRYDVLCLGDNMMKVGKLYDDVYLKYPRLFK